MKEKEGGALLGFFNKCNIKRMEKDQIQRMSEFWLPPVWDLNEAHKMASVYHASKIHVLSMF